MTTSPRPQPSTAGRFYGNGDETRNQCIAKLRDHVVEKIVRDNRITSLLADLRLDQLTRIVEQRIMTVIPDFHTPDHPTYAFMIHRAITELKNEGGSDRESISEFIRTEYDDLPLAHESLLRFQLDKLCEKGEIVLTAMGCYVLSVGQYIQQKKIVVQENGEQRVEKKTVKGSKFKGNEANNEPHEVEVCSRQMKGKKQNGKVGLRPGRRRSRRLKSNKQQEDETNKGGDEFVKDLAQSERENVETRDQKCHAELARVDHWMQDQLFGIFDEPLEPPGFPSNRDQLIKLKQQAQADFQAFRNGAEVKQKQAEKDEMKSESLQLCDGGSGNISEFGDHDTIPLSCGEPSTTVTSLNIISKDTEKLELRAQAPATAIAYDSLTQNHAGPELPGAESADGLPLRSEQGKPEAEYCDPILNQTTAMELLPLREEKAVGLIQFQVLRSCTDDAPDQSVIKPTPPMVQEDQLTLSTEVVTMVVNPTPDAYSTALVTSRLPDGDHVLEKQETPMRRGRGRPRKMTPNGFPIITGSPRKKDGRGRPRKQKPDELAESTTYVDSETTSNNAAETWDWEVAGTRVLEQKSNSGNDNTLALESASQDNEGTIKRKRVGRPPKIDKDKLSESMDSPKSKKGRGKGSKEICYTDISITDLIYSQDHHLQVQPMSRFRGRPRKL